MVRVVDEAVQLRGVPHERVIGLAPEPWLVSLVVAATVSSQGGDCVDVVVSRSSGALGLHDSILLRKGLVGMSEIITASGLDWTMVRFLAPNDGPARARFGTTSAARTGRDST